jgi:hypothetical protein
MRQSIISFVAVYAVVLCTSSCNGGSTSVPSGNSGANAQFQQIERLGRPAVKELFQQFANHDGTNKTSPWQAPVSGQTLYQEIGSFTTAVAGRDAAHAATLQAILIPDEITADLSKPAPAAYLGVETGGATGGTFGGRGLPDDVIDISLGAVFGNTLTALGLVPDDGKQSPCLTTDNVAQKNAQDNVTPAVFPYVGVPH